MGKIILDKNTNVKKILVVLIDYQKQQNFINKSMKFISKESLDQLDYTFDIIISSAILEHIPELDKVLRKLFNFVSSGGYFYARVPYIMPFKKIFKNIPLFIN